LCWCNALQAAVTESARTPATIVSPKIHRHAAYLQVLDRRKRPVRGRGNWPWQIKIRHRNAGGSVSAAKRILVQARHANVRAWPEGKSKKNYAQGKVAEGCRRNISRLRKPLAFAPVAGSVRAHSLSEK